MDSSVSLENQIWFLRVCHHVPFLLYKHIWENCYLDLQGRRVSFGTCETLYRVASSWLAEFDTAVLITGKCVRMISRVLQLYLLLQGLISTQGQARKWISGPVNTKLLSFSRTQSRVVNSLLIGRNTLRMYPYLLGLISSTLCGGVGCVSGKPWFHSDIPIWAPFSWTQKISETWVWG